MAKVRSPNYPSLDLAAAVEAVRPVFKAEHRNKMSREILAKHLGYTSLNGRALGKIGAVRAYGLIDGSGEDLRVSDDAVHILMAPDDAAERRASLERCALHPSLFKEIRTDFPNVHPSESNLRYWLIKNQYTPEAAGKAAEAYLSTMRLVDESGGAYNSSDDADEEAAAMNTASQDLTRRTPPPPPAATQEAPVPAGARKAVFPLSEGDVVLTFPAGMTADGFEELSDYLDIFLRRAKRESSKANAVPPSSDAPPDGIFS